MAKNPQDPPRGPRGGRTTVSADGSLVLKSFFLPLALEKRLRDEAHVTRRPEAEIVREQLALRYPELAPGEPQEAARLPADE